MLIRRTDAADVAPVVELTAAAFASAPHAAPPVDGGTDPGEAALVRWLLECEEALPALSLVAEDPAGGLVGHVVCSRGWVDDGPDGRPALGLGPLSVRPAAQHGGVGSALVHAVLAAADALDETVVALLGDPAYYGRFGFVPASSLGLQAPDPSWGEHFQARALSSYDGSACGRFRYAPEFDRLGEA